MKVQRAWMLPIGLIAVVGTPGCGQKPATMAERRSVAEPESVGEYSSVGDEPKNSSAIPERHQPEIRLITNEVSIGTLVTEREYDDIAYGSVVVSPDSTRVAYAA